MALTRPVLLIPVAALVLLSGCAGPGVARPTCISGDVVVRGAPTWDSKFYLDGVPIPTLYHYGGLKSTYNSDALLSIDFYPGGFSMYA